MFERRAVVSCVYCEGQGRVIVLQHPHTEWCKTKKCPVCDGMGFRRITERVRVTPSEWETVP